MSLRSRIVLLVAAVFASISAASGWLMLNRAETSLQTAFDRTTRTRAAWLLSQVSVDPVVLPLPTNDERILVETDTYTDRHELFRSPGFPKTIPPNQLVASEGKQQSDFQENKNNPQHSRTNQYRWFLQTYRAVTIDQLADETTDTVVRLTLAVPDVGLRQDMEQLRRLFGLGWLLSLVLALLVGYATAGWLLRPIRAMVAQADQIGQATRIDPLTLPSSQDELYTLAVALNRMLDRIRDTISTQRNFFGAAAHELRTPLAVMKTGLEVTLNSGRIEPTLQPFLQSQLDDVRRLTRLLDEFLTLSRPDDTPARLTLTSIQLPNLIANCVARLNTVAEDYAVTILFLPPDTPVEPLLTDAVKLEHVLMNLLENAIKYAVTGSIIKIQLIHEESITIQIKNQTTHTDGPVLDLLQPYFRADPLGDGHGLGLWISHRLTTLLGGTLTLHWQSFQFTASIQHPRIFSATAL